MVPTLSCGASLSSLITIGRGAEPSVTTGDKASEYECIMLR